MPHDVRVSPGRDSERILRLYHLYRIVIGLALVLLISANLEDQLLNVTLLKTFSYGSWCYLIFNILVALAMPSAERLAALFALALTDVLLLCLLYYAANGVPSGIGNLVVISVAVANILLPRHFGLLIAATGATGLIYLTFYLSTSLPNASNQFVQAGFLGMLSFAAALVIQPLVARLASSEQRLQQQSSTVASLEALNASIIARMRTGILVLDKHYRVLQSNAAAELMLGGVKLQGISLTRYFSALSDNHKQWCTNPALLPEQLQYSVQTPQLQPGYVALENNGQPAKLLVFLEDSKHYAQQAQQLKLLALGRLAASIAHEIRNPLGAISHAAQLLGESSNLDRADQRLSEIIQQHSKRLNQVIESVLQVSRQQPARGEILELHGWLLQYADNYHTGAPAENRLQLQLETAEARTRMDPVQLTQVLDNLVANAMRHSPLIDGYHLVRLRLSRHPQLQLPLLDIQDQGPGIPASEQATLFEPFYTTEQRGTGLGLYIARELCKSNQARLDLIDTSQQGACFRITFAHPDTQV